MINLLYFLPFKRIYPISYYTLQLVMLNQFCRRILFFVHEFNTLSFTPLNHTSHVHGSEQYANHVM